MNLYRQWTEATAELDWGVQRVFRDTFALVADGKAHLVWGSDYREGKPCLVNAVANMLSSTEGKGGYGLPTIHFRRVVGLFDRLNAELQRQGVNDASGYVSELAADILLQHFAPPKPIPQDEQLAFDVNEAMKGEAFAKAIYVEPSDEDIARDLLNAMSAPAPAELENEANDHPHVEYARQMVEHNKSQSE
jgi:hypothetical protein